MNRLVRIDYICQLTGMSPDWVRKKVQRGEIPRIEAIRKPFTFDRDLIDRLFLKSSEGAKPPRSLKIEETVKSQPTPVKKEDLWR